MSPYLKSEMLVTEIPYLFSVTAFVKFINFNAVGITKKLPTMVAEDRLVLIDNKST